MSKSKWRGHTIKFDEERGFWVYLKTGLKVSDHVGIKCGHCGKAETKEGHDGCLGTLPGVKNACCGHGDKKDAYVQFLDSTGVYGEDAIKIQKILIKYKV